MNKDEYIHLLYNPEALDTRQATALGGLVQQYPYLQSARALYLKVLYNAESYRYNTELKKTAAHTTDRSVLFDFITSDQFIKVKQPDTLPQPGYEPDIAQEASIETPKPVAAIPEYTAIEIPAITIDEKYIAQEKEENISTKTQEPAEETPVTTVNEAYVPEELQAEQKPELTPAEEKLDIGRPLEFVQEEKHSFREWLQLSKLTPVNRGQEPEEQQEAAEEVREIQDEPESIEKEEAKTKKLEIIDRFIEANPKISPVKNAPVTSLNLERSEDTSYLMTETLARVYLEQKKYNKAIQAYEILILKYPEKSIYFANLISDIKNIQQNNN